MNDKRFRINPVNGFGLQIGSELACNTSVRSIFMDRINNEFAKKPAVRAQIFQGLYMTGYFSEHIDGYGIVQAMDKKVWDAYEAQMNNMEL